ncbi:hypothetical protein [Eleftheria terrae]|uniref:hypothetical protein n=1 Tax=Eleftheria terrae TaxID=1597781 RepID=UPI00263AE5EE|nr:hypothetical protein [Eleftheria terrae]WKB52288.1 hypothetical protein N7L95_21230 [Eleftheria terrae]
MNRYQIKQSLRLATEIDNAGSPLPCYREAAALLRTLAEVAQETKGDTTTKAQYRRMFLAACDALGLVNEALGLDPDDGGAEPILDAIAELKARALHSAPRPTDDELWDQTIQARDSYHDWADKLANAIAHHFGADVGEHSSCCRPWANALQTIEAAQLPADPMDWPLPCDVTVGPGTAQKGTKLRTLVARMQLLHENCEKQSRLNAQQAPEVPPGWRLAPNEPTPEIIAAAALAAWPAATASDLDMARRAARIVLEASVLDLVPGATLDSLAAIMATMAPAYRAMLAAAPQAPRTNTSTNQLTQLLRLIADDAYAASFQTFGQYRSALLKAARGQA